MQTDLTEALRQQRLASYARLQGGFPIPLAGAAYWLALGIAGYHTGLKSWIFFAFVGTGLIFPLALLFARLFKNPFMKERTAVSGVLVPAFIGMLLFWPGAVAAYWTAPDLVPLILAVGLSAHWPVIGWSYVRTPIYAGHAIVRAIAVFVLWLYLPEARTTLLPFAVATVYVLTVLVITVDSAAVRKRLAAGGPA